MPAKPAATRRKKPPVSGILLRYREKDSALGVSRETATRLAESLGVSETQVIHVALAQLARQTLPRYEMDNGPLTDEQHNAIAEQVPQKGFTSTRKRLL
jgi:DNA-binding MurR/RpiR family transcriptional regulator